MLLGSKLFNLSFYFDSSDSLLSFSSSSARSPSPRYSFHQDLSSYSQWESTLFQPPSLSWLIRTIGTSQTSLHSLPAACCKRDPTAVHRGFPFQFCTIILIHFFFTDYLTLSHKPQNPFCSKIRLSGHKGDVHDFRAYSLKYKDSFRVFITKSLLLWPVFTSQDGLLIPQLSACSCNKLCYWLFWIVEAQLKVQLGVLSFN